MKITTQFGPVGSLVAIHLRRINFELGRAFSLKGKAVKKGSKRIVITLTPKRLECIEALILFCKQLEEDRAMALWKNLNRSAKKALAQSRGIFGNDGTWGRAVSEAINAH